jgi:hypothetical protein
VTREALFHCQFGAVQPKRGDVLHKVAAYNSAGRVTASDGTLYDFSRKADEHVGGCIMLPDGAPAEYADPVALWAAAQDAETRIDGQPARLVEFTIPREVPADQRLEFTRAIVAPWVVEGARSRRRRATARARNSQPSCARTGGVCRPETGEHPVDGEQGTRHARGRRRENESMACRPRRQRAR